jgi:Tryptophan-rich sensory protein (mitochondrial benzodiazepine receptor homolog)
MDTLRLRTALLFVACIALPLIIGFVGTLFTYGSLTGWYTLLVKPSFTPPSWVFAPAWTVLYILMGISLFLVMKKGLGSSSLKPAIVLFAAQLVLNLAWSVVFFGMHSILAALAVLLALIVMIAATALVFRRISATATWLLIPYLVWCCFALTLNARILLLN